MCVARLRTLNLAFAALAITLAFGLSRAHAQSKPFKIKGTSYAPDGISLIPYTAAPHSTTGQATELGKYTGEGWFQILEYTSATTASFSSAPNFVFVAANGDHLAVTYGDTDNGAAQSGEVTLTPNEDGSFTASFVAEFNPDLPNCTGRFAKLTGGSWIMYAESDPFFILGNSTTPFGVTWHGEGTLEFKND
ncbi:MAG TPA: hypothetical protein VFA18_16350 [Gemmataceae bacterium]|nr:hypothetical protein [Gemmataceae bacterium]